MTTNRTANRFGRLLGRREMEGSAGTVAADATRAEPVEALPDTARPVVNDAGSYGVQIQPANVPAGTWYWQAVRVHHLTPQENGGNHHLYLDVFDGTGPESQYGGRVNSAQLRVNWEGGSQIVTVDKPVNEPGTNFPLWKWQICSVECLGLPGHEMPSDRVTGVHTGHPDEAAGNTLFHHSFHVTYVKTLAAPQVYTDSVIYGVLHNGSGRTAVLMSQGKAVAQKPLGADETFRFAGLGAGDYTVRVEGTDFTSAVTRVNGRDQVMLNLTLVLKQSVIAGKVRGGAGRRVALLRGTSEVAGQTVASDETYRFAGLEAGAYRVAVSGTVITSPVVNVNGSNTATVDLTAPVQGRPVQHYVLFGPSDRPRTRAALLLALDYICTFKPTFGFSVTEALAAASVTLIGGPEDVSVETEKQLAEKGATVQRVAGTSEEIAAALASRIAGGRAFV